MNRLKTEILPGEYWWGGSVNRGHEMPVSRSSAACFDLYGDGETDQFAPLMLSSAGRYIWSEGAFSVEAKDGVLKTEGAEEMRIYEGFGNLKGAYLAAMKAHFPFSGKMPDELFWKAPQYNTWIELGTEQTQERILGYAHGIIKNGMPPGILMIDGGWQEDYGVYEEFHRGKVPDPEYLISELHKMGFCVMVWVSPIIASAGPRYKMLRDRGFLVRNAHGEPAVRKWWSGYSAVLDLTNPDAEEWFYGSLRSLMDKYGVDGFKFDAGDCYFYRDDDITYAGVTARENTKYFNRFGERFGFNEFRAAWNSGGRPIVARLHDKYHSWDDFGLNTLVSHTVLQGLLGYAFCCPDMVGGGMIDCFGSGAVLDEELFVRWAQANSLMGMMQLSVAPWRVLSPENAKRVIEAVKLHESFGDVFLQLAENAAKTGEPIVRHMAYEFPDEKFEEVSGQFMLGSDILAAPVLVKGAKKKSVKLPHGKWRSASGTVYSGGCEIEADVNADTVLYFVRCR